MRSSHSDLIHKIQNFPESFLINANSYLSKNYGISTSKAAFRLITNACQPEFLSLWKLFDFDELFGRSVEELAQEILCVSSNKRCNAIVTGSPVSWRLLEYIHPLVEEPRLIDNPTFVASNTAFPDEETSAGEELIITYLGPHGAAVRGESASRLSGNGVLLFTDVIGRRGSVLATARLVERFGGECVAIVAPVLISPDLILSELLSAQRPTLRVPERTSDPVRVHSLCHFPIREMAGSDDMPGLITLEELFFSEDQLGPIPSTADGTADAVDFYLQKALSLLENRLCAHSGQDRVRLAQFLVDGLELAFERSYSVIRESDQSIIELDSELHHPHCPPGLSHDASTCQWHWRRQIMLLKNDLASLPSEAHVIADVFQNSIKTFLEAFFAMTELALEGLPERYGTDRKEAEEQFVTTCLQRFELARGFRTGPMSRIKSQFLEGKGSALPASREIRQAIFELFCSFQDRAYESSSVIRIDPLTNFPGMRESPWPMPGPIKPRFSASEMFEMFENSQAMDFGFFRWDQRTLMSAFRLPRIFRTEGDRLWNGIKTLPLDKRSGCGAQTVQDLLAQKDTWTIATTVGFGDIQFRDFFISKAESDGFEFSPVKCFSLPRKDVIGSSSHNYFVPDDIAGVLGNRHVLLLISETYSASTLRELLALLARYDVSSVNVICLISRMSHRESEFLARMGALASGGQLNGYGPAVYNIPISFQSVFNIPEFANEDIQRMQSDAKAVFTDYERRTKVPVYQRLVAQYDKYFRSKEVTSASFAAGATQALLRPEHVDCLGEKVTVMSEEGKLLALCASLITEGKYEPLIQLLRDVTEKEVLFRVVSILMGDIRYLRVTGRTRILYETIQTRIDNERAARVAAEKSKNGNIHACISNEVHIMLGLVLLASHDYVDVRRAVVSFLGWGEGGLNLSRIRENTNNALAFFADERVGWVTSMLLHSGLSDYPHDRRYNALRDELIQFTQSLIQHFNALKSDAGLLYDDAQKAVTTLQLFLSDLGVYEIRRKVDVIRYLHTRLISDTTNHNPVRKELDRIKRLLGAPRELIRQEERTRFPLAFWTGEHQKSTREFQAELSAAIRLSGELELISSALIRLFEFSPLPKDKAGELAVQNDESEFSKRVQKFASLLERARVENRLSFAEAAEITKQARRIQNWLFDPVLSPLRRVLGWYVAPLRKAIIQAGALAEEKLGGRFGPVWKRELERLDEELKAEGEVYVLCLDSFLKEVLENVLANARHAFAGAAEDATQDFTGKVKLEVILEDSGHPITGAGTVLGGVEQPRYVEIRITTWGQTIVPGGLESRASTINRHAREIEDYGGSFRYYPDDRGPVNEPGTMFSLRLVSRSDVRARMDRDKN